MGVAGREPCGELIPAIRTRCEPCAALHRKLKRQGYNRANYLASQDTRKERRRDGYRQAQAKADRRIARRYAVWEIQEEEKAKERLSPFYGFGVPKKLPAALLPSELPSSVFRGVRAARRERIMALVPIIKAHIRQVALVKEYKREIALSKEYQRLKALTPTVAPIISSWGIRIDGVEYCRYALTEALGRRSFYDSLPAPPTKPTPLPWQTFRRGSRRGARWITAAWHCWHQVAAANHGPRPPARHRQAHRHPAARSAAADRGEEDRGTDRASGGTLLPRQA